MYVYLVRLKTCSICFGRFYGTIVNDTVSQWVIFKDLRFITRPRNDRPACASDAALKAASRSPSFACSGEKIHSMGMVTIAPIKMVMTRGWFSIIIIVLPTWMENILSYSGSEWEHSG